MAESWQITSFGDQHDALMQWGRQTIIWSACIKSEDCGKPAESDHRRRQIASEAYEIAQTLWMESVRELAGRLTPADANSLFARKVMERCASNQTHALLRRWP